MSKVAIREAGRSARTDPAPTRNLGVVLFPAFVLSFLWNSRGRFTRDDLRVLWLLRNPCGLLASMSFLYYRVGDPLAFVPLQAAWARKPSFPLATIWEAIRGAVRGAGKHAHEDVGMAPGASGPRGRVSGSRKGCHVRSG